MVSYCSAAPLLAEFQRFDTRVENAAKDQVPYRSRGSLDQAN
jgi:hypothetical protein